MPVKIRLARRGRKHNAIYSIVAADGRAPRDGKFIEKLGQYNPNTNPATIELNFDRALHWLQNGAQPTDTARSILSREGVMMKKHLLEGVKKGAFDEAAAEQKFDTWMADKVSKIQAKKDKLKSEKDAENKAKFEAEQEVNAKRAKAIAEKNAALAKEAEEAVKAKEEEEKAETEAKEETKTEAKEEATEKKTEEKSEEKEVVAETKTEEKKEE